MYEVIKISKRSGIIPNNLDAYMIIFILRVRLPVLINSWPLNTEKSTVHFKMIRPSYVQIREAAQWSG